MDQNTLQQAQRNNTRLLRKTFRLPEESFFQSLKRRLEAFLTNGVSLFNQFCQPTTTNQQQKMVQQTNEEQEVKKSKIKYNFKTFLEKDIQLNQKDRRQQGLPQGINLQNSNNSSNEQQIDQSQSSFELRFRRGSKKIKKENSTSCQQTSKIHLKPMTKHQMNFYQSVNFSMFALQQQNMVEARKKLSQKTTDVEKGNLIYKEYLEFSIRNCSLSQKPNQLPQPLEIKNQPIPIRKERKSLRKKIQFEDQTHQLYDINKVYQVLDAQMSRRQQQRQEAISRKHRQEQEQFQRQRIQAQKQLAQQQILEVEMKKKQVQEQQRKLAEQQLIQKKQEVQAQQQKQIWVQSPFQKPKQLQQPQKNQQLDKPLLFQQTQKKQAPSVEAVSKSQQKKDQPVLKPITVLQEQSSPQKNDKIKDNPFLNAGKRQLGLSDLISSQKQGQMNSFFAANNSSSPTKANNNIFNNNKAPVNNIFNISPKVEPFSQAPVLPIPNPSPIINNGFAVSNPIFNINQSYNPHSNMMFNNSNNNQMFSQSPTPNISSFVSAPRSAPPANGNFAESKTNLFMPSTTPQGPSLFGGDSGSPSPKSNNIRGKKSNQVRIS